MIDTIYIEDEVADHPRTLGICQRFPQARIIPCEHYSTVFNRKSQNFRLQKQRPALILARKFEKHVLPTPSGYGIGCDENYYFSHMLNCLYDCRYCFLQGMYRSAHYLLFVNYEEFTQTIEEKIKSIPESEICFFSGYDCDSLALEPVTGFIEHFLPLFKRHPRAWLELRTKSTQIRTLLQHEPIDNCIIAFSLSPQEIAGSMEHKAPPLAKRIEAIVKLQRMGWRIGLRFDPIIYHQGFEQSYAELFDVVFSSINANDLHSVSLGSFRLPEGFHRNMIQLYPYEPLFAGPQVTNTGMVGYPESLEQQLLGFCQQNLLRHIPESIYFPCTTQ